MLIEQINVVGAEPAEASLHHFADMRGPAVYADHPVALGTRAKLRGDQYLVAPTLDRSTEQLLVGEGAVVLRCVEEVASQFDRAMNCRDRLSFIRRPVRHAHAHTAKTDRRHFQSLTPKFACVQSHGSDLHKNQHKTGYPNFECLKVRINC